MSEQIRLEPLIAISLVVLVVVAVVWLLMDRTGLTAVGTGAVALVETGLVTLARRVAPSLPLYAVATAIVVSALGVWWWSEN